MSLFALDVKSCLLNYLHMTNFNHGASSLLLTKTKEKITL